MVAFEKSGQRAWYHDEGHVYGYFHTFDDFRLEGYASRKLHILLPRDYETANESYPVLYMQDGQTAFWNGPPNDKSWHAGRTLSNLSEAGSIQNIIVVAICPLDPDYEYTHVEWAEGRAHGGLGGYAEFVAQHLKPWVDRAYRTQSSRQSTAMIGAAHGGLASFYIATHYPHIFGIAGCLSSAFWVGMDRLPDPWVFRDSISFTHIQFFKPPMEKSVLIQEVQHTLGDKSKHPRLWIDWGLRRDNEFNNAVVEKMSAEWSQEMGSLLINRFNYEKDVDIWLHEDAMGGHDEDAWGYRFGLFVSTFFNREVGGIQRQNGHA